MRGLILAALVASAVSARSAHEDVDTPAPTRRPIPRDETFTFNPASNTSIDVVATITPGSSSAPSASSSGSTSTTRAATYTLPSPPQPAPTKPPSPAPIVFDTTVAYSLSSGCQDFLTHMAASEGFNTCLPFSLLLSSSASFKQQVQSAIATGNYTYLNTLLAYTSSPQPAPDTCDQNYTNYLKQLVDKSNCGSDMATKAVIKAARRGISNYAVMRTASSLLDPKTGRYCYLQAVASDKPDDLYLWMIPSGNILPPTSTPTCSACSGLLMNHLSQWSSNTTSLNATIMSSAVDTINRKCGSGFISYTPPQSTNHSIRALHVNGLLGFLVLCFVSIIGLL